MPPPLPPLDPALAEAARTSAAWPFEEARKLVQRLERTGKGEALFETGYGPSGLPHIGTFGEVARTSMVRHAFRVLTGDTIPTRLVAFSDDMDGLRKVPDNVPNKELVAEHLGKPLTQVPDPFGTHESFGASQQCAPAGLPRRVRLRLRVPLRDGVLQGSGRFDQTLLTVLDRYDAVMAIMLPVAARGAAADLLAVPAAPSADRHRHAGADRRSAARGRHHRLARSGHGRAVRDAGDRRPRQAAMEAGLGHALGGARRRLRDGRQGPDRQREALGRDRAGRSAALPPEGFNYELFLDEKGQKISKSKGNGLTIDEWLAYGTPESLVSVHVHQAARGQAALLRRDPAHRRRLPDVSGEISGPGRQDAARQPGLAHP